MIPVLGLTLFTVASVAWPSLSTEMPRAGGGEGDAAVVVGISKYAFLPEIPGAAENAKDWAQYLKRVRGIPAERVIVLTDAEATRERILRAARDARATKSMSGRVWLVFVGHGAPSSSGDDGVLLGVDTQADLESLNARGVLQKDALEAIGDGAVAVFDACFSGKSADGSAPLVAGMQATVPVRRPTNAKAMVFTSSATFAGPLPGTARPAFSYVLLGALRGWADGNHDGRVTFTEAASFSRDTLRQVLKSEERLPDAHGAAADTVLATDVREAAPDVQALSLGTCPDGSSWTGRVCERAQCPADAEWNGVECRATQRAIACPRGTAWDGSQCVAQTVTCPSGTTWNGSSCVFSKPVARQATTKTTGLDWKTLVDQPPSDLVDGEAEITSLLHVLKTPQPHGMSMKEYTDRLMEIQFSHQKMASVFQKMTWGRNEKSAAALCRLAEASVSTAVAMDQISPPKEIQRVMKFRPSRTSWELEKVKRLIDSLRQAEKLFDECEATETSWEERCRNDQRALSLAIDEKDGEYQKLLEELRRH